MPAPYKGSCQCGNITYEVTGEPLTYYVCHCKQCQKQTSSAYGMSVRFQSTDFKLLTGTLGEKDYVAESGRPKTGAFCPQCGSRIYHDTAASDDTINIKPGTLDNADDLAPIAHIWTMTKMPWVEIPADIMTYDGQPESFGELLKAWVKR